MTRIKKLVTISTLTIALVVTSVTAFAATYATPEEMLASKILILKDKVAKGTMTQEKADEIIKALEENAANCDQTGSAKIGQNMGAGFGQNSKNGEGNGTKQHLNNGQGLGNRQQGNSQGQRMGRTSVQ